MLRSSWLYLKALLDHWIAFVTSSGLAALAAIVANVFGILIPARLYGEVALGLGLFVAGFKAWREQRDHSSALERERDAALAASQTAVTPKDWQDLAKEFEKVEPDVRADWYTQSDRPRRAWNLAGGYSRRNCETFCRLAGQMLMRSPKVCASLDASVRDIEDPIERWLEFVAARSGAPNRGSGSIEAVDGGVRSVVLIGSIDAIGAESVRACFESSGVEI